MSEFYLCTMPKCNRKYKSASSWVVHMQKEHNKEDELLILPAPVKLERNGSSTSSSTSSRNNAAILAEKAAQTRRQQEKEQLEARQRATQQVERETRDALLREQQ